MDSWKDPNIKVLQKSSYLTPTIKQNSGWSYCVAINISMFNTETRQGATIFITAIFQVTARAFPSRIKSLCKHNQIVFSPRLTTVCFKSLFIQCKNNSQTFEMHLIGITAYRAPLRWDFKSKIRCNSKFITCYRNNPCLSRFSCSLLPIVSLFSKWCHATEEGNLNDSFIRSFFKTFMPSN